MNHIYEILFSVSIRKLDAQQTIEKYMPSWCMSTRICEGEEILNGRYPCQNII